MIGGGIGDSSFAILETVSIFNGERCVSSYRGELADFMPEGIGEIVNANRDVSLGNFHRGALHGLGQIKFASGDVVRAIFEGGAIAETLYTNFASDGYEEEEQKDQGSMSPTRESRRYDADMKRGSHSPMRIGLRKRTQQVQEGLGGGVKERENDVEYEEIFIDEEEEEEDKIFSGKIKTEESDQVEVESLDSCGGVPACLLRLGKQEQGRDARSVAQE